MISLDGILKCLRGTSGAGGIVENVVVDVAVEAVAAVVPWVGRWCQCQWWYHSVDRVIFHHPCTILGLGSTVHWIVSLGP